MDTIGNQCTSKNLEMGLPKHILDKNRKNRKKGVELCAFDGITTVMMQRRP
jgi:hypothetical protein